MSTKSPLELAPARHNDHGGFSTMSIFLGFQIDGPGPTTEVVGNRFRAMVLPNTFSASGTTPIFSNGVGNVPDCWLALECASHVNVKWANI